MPPSTHLGKFRLERPLGAGAFATVWLARDEVLDAPVAIKVLAENWSRNADVRRRFVDEARILRQIDSDRVVRVFAIDVLEDERPYFVMEWADRGTLYDRLIRRGGDGSLSVRDALVYTVEIARCLSVVHEFGMVHRDVKPSNVLFRSVAAHHRKRVGSAERVLLADFGLAKEVVGSSGFTVAAGTPAYSAPEQARGNTAVDQRADFYALTAVLYELLAGVVPFPSTTFRDASVAMADRIPRPSEVRSGIPPALDELVQRGLSPAASDRFADADELIDALLTIIGELDDEAPVAPTVDRSVDAAVAAPTGHVARAVQIVDRAVALLGESAELTAVRDRLLGPGRLAVLASDDAAAAQAEIALYHAGMHPVIHLLEHPVEPASAPGAGPGDLDGLGAADVVVLAGPYAAFGELVAQARTVLRDRPGGPVAMAALVTSTTELSTNLSELSPSPPIDLSAGPIEPIARIAPAADPGEVVALVERILLDPAQTVGVSAALAELAALSRRAVPPHSIEVWPVIDDLLDRLRIDMWRTEEIDLARADVRGELFLPAPLRAEVRRLLLGADSIERLDLAPGASTEEICAAATARLERWHALVGASRIPFRARGQADVVVRVLERLWVSVGG